MIILETGIGEEMRSRNIKLPRGIWTIDEDEAIGKEGGFGRVYAGSGIDMHFLAIKKLKISATEAAHRELAIADELIGKEFQFVIPIHDSGLDADSDEYFVVMDRAERSLEDEVQAQNKLPEKDVIEILVQIATGLNEVIGIVHRDLKPDNILLHEEKWKIADFGIARFIEESTSLNTLKNFLTAPYGAPEQWEAQRATHATDVYALGCIGYKLLTGNPPFIGPANEDFKEQHLKQNPPELKEASSTLRSLLAQMLRKSPQVRPEFKRIIELLNSASNNKNDAPALNALSKADAKISEKNAKEEAKRIERARIWKDRNILGEEGIKILEGILNSLLEKIRTGAPNASSNKTVARWDRFPIMVSLGQGMLEIEYPYGMKVIPKNRFQQSGWDVVTGARISVKTSNYERSASLWFSNLGKEAFYRWYEVSYFAPFRSSSDVPFSLPPENDADYAASNVMHSYAHATTPKPIDNENSDDFCDRWIDLFAKAAEGSLSRPTSLPIN